MATIAEELFRIGQTPTTAELEEDSDIEKGLLSIVSPKKEEEPKPIVGLDQDVPVGLSAPEEQLTPEAPVESEMGFTERQEALKTESEQKQVAQVNGKAVPTSIQDLYYSGDVGKQMREKEQSANNVYADEFATAEELERARVDIAEVYEYKNSIYDAIEGDNVEDVGTGKVITNPDGSTRFVPGPGQNELTQLLRKTVTDTARGVLGLIDQEELVPRVSTKDAAVATISEVLQLGMGGFAGLGAVAKAEKYARILSNSPKLQAFFKGASDIGLPTGPRAKAIAESLTNKAKGFTDSVFVKGTVSSALGAAAVADDDVATFFGTPGMSQGEVKMKVLQDTLLFGFGLNVFKGVGEVTALTPALKLIGSKVAGSISAIMASVNTTKADNKVIEALAEAMNQTSTKVAKAKTAEEIDQIYAESYEQLKEIYPKLSGGQSLDDMLNSIDAPVEGGPMADELLGNKSLMAFVKQAMKYSGSQSKASAELSKLLSQADSRRQEALAGRVVTAREELAPRGEEAGEIAAEELQKEEAAMLARMEKEAGEEISAVRTEAQASRMEAEKTAEEATTAAEEAVMDVEVLQLQTAETVSNAVQSSKLNLRNLDDLNNLIDEDGAVVKITDVLEKDLGTKDALGSAKDKALRGITISGEEAQGIVNDLIGAYKNPNFLIDDESVRAAGKEVSKLIRIFKSVDEAAEEVVEGAPTPPAPVKAPSQIDLRLAEINAELASGAGGNQARFLQLLDEAEDLMKRGAKMPPTKASSAAPVTEAGEEAIEELPNITALDLQQIISSTRRRANNFASKAQAESDQQAFDTSKGLKAYADKLEERLTTYLDTNPVAKKASDDFNTFFNDFKERWRNTTGREWQGDIIGSNTRVDIAGAEQAVLDVFTNPSATGKQLQLIKEIVAKMPEEARTEFIGSIGTRLVSNFSKSRQVVPDPTTGEFNVQQATSLLKELDRFISKSGKFEGALPGAFNQLKQIKADLERVVAPAVEAQKAAKTIAKKSGKAVKEAEKTLAKTERELTANEQDAIRSIEKRLQAAVSESERSVLAKMLNQDDPTQFVASLFTKANGYKQYKELWDRAGTIGTAGDSGLTPTQEALQETLTFAMLSKVYTPEQELVGDVPMALKLITNAISTNKSTPGRMFQLAFENNPAGKEVLDGLKMSIARYVERQKVPGLGAIGSTTFEKGMLNKMVDDIFMVMYGPLTKDFRQARFMNRIIFGAFDGDIAVAEAFVRVLTDPRYSVKLLEKARDLAKNKLITEEEAFSSAFFSTMMLTQGVKKYNDATDPLAELQETARGMAIMQQTEEGLGASPDQRQ